MKACNCTNKNWHLVCDSCGGNLPSCLDCTDTERQLKEARAEIDKLNAIADMQRARLGKREEAIAERDKLIEQMREALKLALTECRSTHCENKIKAALLAAGRGGK